MSRMRDRLGSTFRCSRPPHTYPLALCGCAFRGHLAHVGIGCERIEQTGVNRRAVVFDLRFQPVGRHLGFRPDKTKRFHGCCIEVEKRRHIRVGAKREPVMCHENGALLERFKTGDARRMLRQGARL